MVPLMVLISGNKKSGFKTKAEAEDEMNRILDAMRKSGSITYEKKISLREVYNEFLKVEAENTRRYSTKIKYNSIFQNHIEEYFQNNFVYNVTSKKLQLFINEKSDEYSSEYVNGMYNLLLVLFTYAKKANYIRSNPMLSVVRPPKDDDSIKIYSREELLTLQRRIDGTNYYSSFMLGLYLGVRAGECYALRWSDINWETNTIRIDKQLQYQNQNWCFSLPKTANGNRTIKFGLVLKEYLIELKASQEERKQKAGETYIAENKIIDVRKKPAKIILECIRELKNAQKSDRIVVG